MHCAELKSELEGDGINVARVLNMLGVDVVAIFLSGGCTGAHLNELIQNENVPFITIPCKNKTRENFAILEESTKKQFHFGMPSNEFVFSIVQER